MNRDFKNTAAAVNSSAAMEAETIQKNGASPKSHTSRRKLNFISE
jgi:hypothetical protein